MPAMLLLFRFSTKQLMETPVWHVDNYIGEMEGPDSEAEPLTMRECAEVAEQCLFGRTKVRCSLFCNSSQ